MARQRHSQNKYSSFISIPQGFSLLEVVIAMLILSITSAGTFSIYVTCNKLLIEAQNRLQAIEQASGVLEQLQEYVSANPNRPANSTAVLEDGVDKSPILMNSFGDQPDIRCVSNPAWVYDVANDPDTGGKVVTVRINWGEI